MSYCTTLGGDNACVWRVTAAALAELMGSVNAGVGPASRINEPQQLCYLDTNLHSLIDYRSWQQAGRRISTGFVESTINLIAGRRMSKGQQIRWSRLVTHCIVQVRTALLNQELDELAQRQFPWIGERRVSWPWQQTSHPF
jgi:hypothetical protein